MIDGLRVGQVIGYCLPQNYSCIEIAPPGKYTHDAGSVVPFMINMVLPNRCIAGFAFPAGQVAWVESAKPATDPLPGPGEWTPLNTY